MSETRREFLQIAMAGATLSSAVDAQPAAGRSVPWYLRTYRWGQTNITEKDPVRYDIPWWREFWKQTAVQGVIINAGGIVAYYPSKFPLQHRAEFLKGRDLYGELAKAAHEDGLVVMARMDSNRTAADFYEAHPDWFARQADGGPYRAADKYITCINSPYYDEYIPGILREIIERSHPEGITDNSWAGMGRANICYCDNCERKFRSRTGQPIPRRADWDDSVYRQWIMWNYERRTEIWELNNRIAQAAGGPECIWSGMNSGSVSAQAASFRDLKEICSRAQILMLDHQRRDDSTGFQQNGDTGKRVHGLMGWEKLAPESMAMYENGATSFRVASKPAAEARMWMFAGIAGDIQPWWHYVGAYHEDRRMYHTPGPVMQWHKANQEYLTSRRPVASVGIVWSQRNTDFYGRNNAGDLVDAPYEGFAQAMIRARIPYLPVHAEDIGREAPRLGVLILPNVGGLSDAQCAAIRQFVERGGSLVASGQSSLYTEWGDARPDFALADLLRVHILERPARPQTAGTGRRGGATDVHTYLRLHPELRSRVYGPEVGDEPKITGARHPVLRGFDETDILAFGGTLQPLKTDAGATVLLTFVPEFPIYPPETAWMRTSDTNVPGLVVSEHPRGGRIAYLAADLDRRYFHELLPDHGDLLANLVRWTAGDTLPLEVHGSGLVDCHLYTQEKRMILHLLNLTSSGTWRSPIDELTAVGPLSIRVRSQPGWTARNARRLVANAPAALSVSPGWAEFRVDSILDHEVVIIS